MPQRVNRHSEKTSFRAQLGERRPEMLKSDGVFFTFPAKTDPLRPNRKHVVGKPESNSKLGQVGSRWKCQIEQGSKYTLIGNSSELVFY